MYELVFKTLTADGFDVFAPGQHTGVCDSSYVVVKNGGQTPFLTSLAYDIVDVIVYCPLSHYSRVSPYLQSVMQSVKKLKELKNTHTITPVFVDPDKKAYMMSVKYQVYKRRML